MVTSLARFFRISLSRGSNIIPIADELEHAGHYLTIQKMRYKNKFSASITADDDVQQLYTIKLIVQPILENAIYHGMMIQNISNQRIMIPQVQNLGLQKIVNQINENVGKRRNFDVVELSQKAQTLLHVMLHGLKGEPYEIV